MSGYYEAIKTIQMKGGHVCSRCKSVIITDFKLNASATSKWSQTKAQEGAEKGAEQGLKALRAFGEKPFLVTESNICGSGNIVAHFSVTHLNHSCPYCGNRERWQLEKSKIGVYRLDPVSGVTLVEDVPEESRLTVWVSTAELREWQTAVMHMNTINVRKYWKDHIDEANRICAQIQDLKKQIEVLKAEKATVREKTQWLHAKIVGKEEAVKGFPLFSSERKNAKAELKELNKQYRAQSKADHECEKSIISGIASMEKQMKELKINNPGVMGNVEMVTANDAPYCQAIRLC